LAIQSIERAAAILQALGSGPRRLGVSELSERLGLAKGTVHGLLKALQQERFVEQEAESGKYQLGAALLQLGNIYLDVNELRGRSLAWSDNLALRTGEAVRVGSLHDNGVLVIHHVFRPDNTLQILEVGAQLPLHATALGKAILANNADLEAEVLARPLPPLTRATLTTRAGLERALEAVRKQAYASECEEAIIGEASIAAAIFDRHNQATGAIGIAGPVERLYAKREPKPELIVQVREAARAITRDLGGARL
jgi:DNA-binding IclR family transcriptional regulator